MVETTMVSLDKPLGEKGFILQVKVYIARERLDEFLTLFRRVYDLVAAEEECLFFVVGVQRSSPLDGLAGSSDDGDDGCVAVSWSEGWKESVDWFVNVQFNKDYYKPYLKATEPMFVKPREILVLGPQAGMCNFKME